MAQSGLKVCRVMHDFVAESEGELSVQENSIGTLLVHQSDVDWSYVTMEDGSTGYVPTTHIQITEESPNQNAPSKEEDTQSSSSSDDELDHSSVSTESGLGKTEEKKTFSNTNQTIVPRAFIGRSAFSTSGAEKFLRGEETKVNLKDLQEYEKHIIMMINGVLVWKPVENVHTYRIGSTETDSKFGGTKSYTNYKIHASNAQSQDKGIRKRYKQFDWLYKRLIARFPTTVIPKLPEKMVRGRFNESIVQMRRELLEAWLNRLARHPIISESQLFSGFLKLQDNVEWKNYKRTKEEDPANQSGFFARTDIVSEFNRGLNAMQDDLNNWEKLNKNLHESMSCFKEVLQNHSTDFARYYHDEFVTVAKAITNFSACFQAENHYPAEFSLAIKSVGDSFMHSGKEFQKKQKQDAVPLRKGLEEYLNLVSSQKRSHSVAKETLKKLKDAKKRHQESSISDRCATVYATVEAEMNHFQQESVRDISELMMRYLRFQVVYHKTVARNFEDSLESFMRFSGKPMNGHSKNVTDIPPPPSASTITVSATSQSITTSASAESSVPPIPPALQSEKLQENSF